MSLAVSSVTEIQQAARDYRAAVATTLGWAVATYAFNVVADTNYGYLVRKPGTSILDLLGPWVGDLLEPLEDRDVALEVAVHQEEAAGEDEQDHGRGRRHRLHDGSPGTGQAVLAVVAHDPGSLT